MDTPNHKQIEWHVDVLPPATKRALNFLSTASWLKRSVWYLAGGTALALYEGHRASVDLDFFTEKKSFSLSGLLDRLPKDSWTVDILKEGTIYGKLFGAKVSFISYPFFKKSRPYNFYGTIPVLDPHDVAVMKIIAISQRGRKRDFIDLYLYCQKYESLVEIIECLPAQYPTVIHEHNHILRSLTYFVDADTDPMPQLYFVADWKKIKSFFRHEVTRVAKSLLELT